MTALHLGSPPQHLGRTWPVIRGPWPPHRHDGAVHDECVASELTGVLHRPDEPVTGDHGPGVGEHGDRRVHPPQRGTAEIQCLVEHATRISQHPPTPPQVPGQTGESFSRAEPDQHQSHRGCGVAFLHLDQVLLTGQSMPVPHQHEEVDTLEVPQIDSRTAAGVGHGDAAEGDGHRLVPRH